MTVYQSIPSAGVLEAFAPGFTHTSVTRHFGVMQRALGAWIEAERDLEHSGSWDPACDHWLRDAEAARAAVGAALDALCDTPAERLEDRPLLRIARLTRALGAQRGCRGIRAAYARVATSGHCCAARDGIRWRWGEPDAGRGRGALAQLAALPIMRLVIDGNCVEIMPEDVSVAEAAWRWLPTRIRRSCRPRPACSRPRQPESHGPDKSSARRVLVRTALTRRIFPHCLGARRRHTCHPSQVPRPDCDLRSPAPSTHPASREDPHAFNHDARLPWPGPCALAGNRRLEGF